jgi:hypothetical protein
MMTRILFNASMTLPWISVVHTAVAAHVCTIPNRSAHARQVIRHGGELIGIEAVEEAHEIRIDIRAVKGTDAAHLAEQIRIVLVAQRRDETLIIAPPVIFMARGTLFAKNCFAQLDPAPIAVLCYGRRRQAVEIGSEVCPRLGLCDARARNGPVHFIAVAHELGEIRKLLDQVRAPLSCERRHDLVGITLRPRPVTLHACLGVERCTVRNIRFELECGSEHLLGTLRCRVRGSAGQHGNGEDPDGAGERRAALRSGGLRGSHVASVHAEPSAAYSGFLVIRPRFHGKSELWSGALSGAAVLIPCKRCREPSGGGASRALHSRAARVACALMRSVHRISYTLRTGLRHPSSQTFRLRPRVVHGSGEQRSEAAMALRDRDDSPVVGMNAADGPNDEKDSK